MNKDEKKLLENFRQLPDDSRKSLLDFAQFLCHRDGDAGTGISPELVPIERPAEETVIAAIKRLAATYPMLDRDKLLNETSSLVSQHVLQGRQAGDVIDELEEIFKTHYDALRKTPSA